MSVKNRNTNKERDAWSLEIKEGWNGVGYGDRHLGTGHVGRCRILF